MHDDEIDEEGEPDFEERVGYGRPPKQHRWPKGFSPNPGGRPRKCHTRRHTLEQIAYRKISYVESGKSREATTLKAIILMVKNKAVAGNAAASRLHDQLQGISFEEEDAYVPRAVFFCPEKLTVEEWEAIYSSDATPHVRETRATSSLNPANEQGEASDRRQRKRVLIGKVLFTCNVERPLP